MPKLEFAETLIKMSIEPYYDDLCEHISYTDKENKFIDDVLSGFSDITLSDFDKKCVANMIKHLMDVGFTVRDARRYIGWTEYMNPDLDEDKALKWMKELYMNYVGKIKNAD